MSLREHQLESQDFEEGVLAAKSLLAKQREQPRYVAFAGNELRQMWIELLGNRNEDYCENNADAALRKAHSTDFLVGWLVGKNGTCFYLEMRKQEEKRKEKQAK